jgi:ankyrin repeat protein
VGDYATLTLCTHITVTPSTRRVSHLELLVLARADPLATQLSTGRGPIHLAAAGGHAETVTTLARLGADASSPDRAGSTPLDIAKGRALDAVAEALAAGSWRLDEL